MDENFEELIHNFVRERTSEIVVSLREDDVTYQKAFRKSVDNSKAAEKVRENDFTLSSNEFNSLRIYLNSANEMGFIEHLKLYGAGYTDCIKLLRKLQVL